MCVFGCGEGRWYWGECVADPEGQRRGVIRVDYLSDREYVCHSSYILYIPTETLSELSSELCFPHKEIKVERC